MQHPHTLDLVVKLVLRTGTFVTLVRQEVPEICIHAHVKAFTIRCVNSCLCDRDWAPDRCLDSFIGIFPVGDSHGRFSIAVVALVAVLSIADT